MDELRECGHCGSTKVRLSKKRKAKTYGWYNGLGQPLLKHHHYGTCGSCHARGPVADSEQEAIAAWNRRHHAPAPDCFNQAGGYSDKRCLGMAPAGDDEPIEKCKQCFFCTANERRRSPKPEALTLGGEAINKIVVTGRGDEVLAVISADHIVEKNGVSVTVDWV